MELVSLGRTTSRDFRRRETHRLFAELRDATGSRRAALLDEVIVLNTQIAYNVARRYQNRGVALDDLEQVACLALVRAAQRFDPDSSEDFLTYAVPTISGELKRHFRDHGWMVRPTRRLQELQARIRHLVPEQDPHQAEHLAAVLDVPVEDVVAAQRLDGCFAPSSLDAPVGAADSTDLTLGDTLVGDDRAFARAETRMLLDRAMTVLDERQRRVLRLRFVDDLTQQEIGERLGVTQMQVSRLLAAILRKLRAELEPVEEPVHAAS